MPIPAMEKLYDLSMPFGDPWDHISPKRLRMLDQSWPGLFRQYILSELPVREFAPFFDPGFGRPTKDLSTVLGILILQQTLALDDEEAIEQLAFNMQVHYALDITEESDAANLPKNHPAGQLRSVQPDPAVQRSPRCRVHE